MSKRPLPVTIIGVLLVLFGAGGFVGHAREGGKDLWGILPIELTALIAGVFLLRGNNWARWLAIAWIAFHVGLSFFESMQRVFVHSVILVLFAYFLFRPSPR